MEIRVAITSLEIKVDGITSAEDAANLGKILGDALAQAIQQKINEQAVPLMTPEKIQNPEQSRPEGRFENRSTYRNMSWMKTALCRELKLCEDCSAEFFMKPGARIRFCPTCSKQRRSKGGRKTVQKKWGK